MKLSPTGVGCERIFMDTASGKLARQAELDAALRTLRAGDQLVVTKLDRLGRSLEHLIELSHQLQTAGVDLVVLVAPGAGTTVTSASISAPRLRGHFGSLRCDERGTVSTLAAECAGHGRPPWATPTTASLFCVSPPAAERDARRSGHRRCSPESSECRRA